MGAFAPESASSISWGPFPSFRLPFHLQGSLLEASRVSLRGGRDELRDFKAWPTSLTWLVTCSDRPFPSTYVPGLYICLHVKCKAHSDLTTKPHAKGGFLDMGSVGFSKRWGALLYSPLMTRHKGLGAEHLNWEVMFFLSFSWD